MTMLREFFDITKDSSDIFEGLNIMNTEYASLINTKPVIFLTFKDCKGATVEELQFLIKQKLYHEYLRYEKVLRDKLDRNTFEAKDFYAMIDVLREADSSYPLYSTALQQLTQVVKDGFGIKPVLLIDEYDQPIISSYEYGYHETIGTFFSNFYGSAMKGNAALDQALLTGVQRVAKESIFSQFNNARVYTVLHRQYAPYFGLTVTETEKLLTHYGLDLNEDVQNKYDGYLFGGIEMYNPWSILNYADIGTLDNYWINTSSNYLIRSALQSADRGFWEDFDQLVTGKAISVWLTLETSYIELDSNYSL